MASRAALLQSLEDEMGEDDDVDVAAAMSQPAVDVKAPVVIHAPTPDFLNDRVESAVQYAIAEVRKLVMARCDRVYAVCLQSLRLLQLTVESLKSQSELSTKRLSDMESQVSSLAHKSLLLSVGSGSTATSPADS